MKNSVEIRAHITYNALLVGILILYGLSGALVFRKLEAVNSASFTNDRQLKDSKEKLLKELWNQNSLEFDQWWTQARNKLDSYEKNVMFELSNTAEWNLTNSWLFSFTVFTTIGDGNIVPVSTCGRIFCVIYGVLGIPLFNVVASSLISFITGVFRFLYSANLRRKRQREATKQKKDEDWSALQTIDDDSQEFHLTLINAFSMVTAYLAAGVVLFSLWEEWSLFESFYFCFMTLTSIGLGGHEPRNLHYTVYGGYIIMGLVLFIMLFSAIEEEITKRLDKIKQMVGLVENAQEDNKDC